jgi:hypothetical protein
MRGANMGRWRYRACLEEGMKLDLNRLFRGGFSQARRNPSGISISWHRISFGGVVAAGTIEADFREEPIGWVALKCSFSWNRDPAAGVIFIQSGPRRVGSTLASRMLGGLDWNAGCGDDCQDTPGVLFPWQADQGDLRRTALVAQGRAEGHPLERDRVPLRAFAAAASPDWTLARAA